MTSTVDETLRDYLRTADGLGASSVHLSVGSVPCMRRDGNFTPFGDGQALAAADVVRMVRSVLGEAQWDRFCKHEDVSFSFDGEHGGRVLGGAYRQQGLPVLVARFQREPIPTAAELGLPEALLRIVDGGEGFVLLIGPRGHGVSSTLAHLVQRINDTRSCHMVIVEEQPPVVYAHRRSVIDQREVGSDVVSVGEGLVSAFDHDPDVVVASPIREGLAATAILDHMAVGRLVIATMVGRTIPEALEHLVAHVSIAERAAARATLAAHLRAVISQRIVTSVTGRPMPVFEFVVPDDEIVAMIRDGRVADLRSVMLHGRANGMRTLEHDLNRMVAVGLIERNEALRHANRPSEITDVAGPDIFRSETVDIPSSSL